MAMSQQLILALLLEYTCVR